MRVRSILLALALGTGLLTVAEATAKKVSPPPKFKSAAAARKNATKQAKSHYAKARKASKAKPRKPVKH